MSVLGYFDGDLKDWSIDLAGLRAQFPEKLNEKDSSITDLQILQRQYFKNLLHKDPDRLKKTGVILDSIIRTKGAYIDVLSLDPRRVMEDDAMRSVLISRDPHSEGRSSSIAHAAKEAIHAGLSYDLFLQLKQDPNQRQTYLDVVQHSLVEYSEKHRSGDERKEWPGIADLVAGSITHGIMQKMQKMRVKPVRRAKSA